MGQDKALKIFIDKRWVTGETCLWSVSKDQYFYASLILSKKRTDFVKRLEEEGFLIVFDHKDIDEDTICFVMDTQALCTEDVELSYYKRLFDQNIFEKAGELLNYPLSLSAKDYFEHPFFPAVFKNEVENGGVDKFLVETEKQFEIMKSFYEKCSLYSDVFPEAFKGVIFQKYLKSPGKYTSYLRILLGGSGEVMGANVKYSIGSNQKDNLMGLFEQVFLHADSPYFINAKKMFNYYAGGGNISFHQPKYSSEKVSVLEALGFDMQDLKLPEELLTVCKNIMLNCNSQLGVLCGIDFMFNEEDRKWYYLENQAFPAIDEWAQEKGIRLPKQHDVKDYLKYLEFELEARYEALMMLVREKQRQKEEQKVVKLGSKKTES